MPDRQWGVAPANDPTGSILRKATGISAQPEPSWGRKFLELVTGYPANPMKQTEPTDVMGAGLPFLNILGAGGIVGHGTQKVFDYFNNKENDVNDVLGWLSHAAEDMPYAEGYAGGMKGKFVNFNSKLPIESHELRSGSTKLAPRMIPMQLHNKNTLDLVNPNPDDISHALAALDPYDRKNLIEQFKDARRRLYSGEAYKEEFLPTRHYSNPGSVPMNEVPLRHVAENIRMNPESFKKSPFDAIRYRDVEKKAWAFPDTTPVKTPWGVDVTNPPKELKVIKTDKPSGGILEVHPDRWNNPSDLAAQLKTNPDMKLTGAQVENLYYDNKITSKQKSDLYKNNVMTSAEQVAGSKFIFGKHEPEKKTAEEWKSIAENESPGLNPWTVHPNSNAFKKAQSKLKNEMEAQGLGNYSSTYLSNIIAKHGKSKFTMDEINKLNNAEMMTESELNYMKQHHMIDEPNMIGNYKPETLGTHLNQSQVDDLLAKHQHGPIVQNTPNGPIKGVQTSEGHFIPDSKQHPNEWASKILELNPHYTDEKIGDMYTSGNITQNEYNALWNAKQKQSDDLAHKWLSKNMDLSSGIAYGGHYDTISKAIKKGEVSPSVWGVYNKLVGSK